MAAKKIERLTAEQELELRRTLNEYLIIGRSVERIDQRAAADAITAMYSAIGKPRPAFMFFSSPAMCSLAWLVLSLLLESQLRSQLGSQLRSQLGHYFGGSLWSGWEVFYDFCALIGVKYLAEHKATLALWITQSRTCHWWWPYDGLVLVSDRPTKLNLDARGRLHSAGDHAIEYSDGWGMHAWHGVRVPPELIELPIDPQMIARETNQEVRRVMIERLGWGNYIQAVGAQALQKDRFGELYSIDDQLVVLVRNSTPEPDGTSKMYALQVRRGARTAAEAVASTFGLSVTDYAPEIET